MTQAYGGMLAFLAVATPSMYLADKSQINFSSESAVEVARHLPLPLIFIRPNQSAAQHL